MALAKYWNNLLTVVFGSTALVITIANLVTIVVFLKQKLRKRSHFSLISLAIADLMVGALAVPLYVVVAGFQTNENLLVVFFRCVDIFTGLLSIFTLASISLERMHSVSMASTSSRSDVTILLIRCWHPMGFSGTCHLISTYETI